ncbi:hypothetical protein SAMN06297280_3399 [Arsukibacterium tuosuense]|uniref:Uncharacterized protein n=1 Tax=Arsukibacterium tuosuense TaxID=1323745 RepID=A0A285JDS4_9GAMM|nr:hypothetical protein [Arsukibacterium tuosuense]SNY58429.1 hypothetical protein SAMN06297280_3399 [Arsukibacterium tuosuense]
MITIPLERCDNFLILPEALSEQDYVITPTKNSTCWHILPAELQTKLVQILSNTNNTAEQDRLTIMLQGTYMPLAREGNLLLLPKQLLAINYSSSRYVLKLEQEPEAD